MLDENRVEGTALLVRLNVWPLMLKIKQLVVKSKLLQRHMSYILLHACFSTTCDDRCTIPHETYRNLVDFCVAIFLCPQSTKIVCME